MPANVDEPEGVMLPALQPRTRRNCLGGRGGEGPLGGPADGAPTSSVPSFAKSSLGSYGCWGYGWPSKPGAGEAYDFAMAGWVADPANSAHARSAGTKMDPHRPHCPPQQRGGGEYLFCVCVMKPEGEV